MGYVYNVYGTRQVEDATNMYNRVATSAPNYADSAATLDARRQADSYADKYKKAVDNGYTSNYAGNISKLADRYVNNEFNWNADNSSEYQQYKSKYQREGAKQQENVQGSYAANTGGYTNSYAQAAGQKAYNSYMDELQEKIPALKQSAYESWSQEQENTLNKIGVLQGLDDNQYQRYRDSVQDNYDFMTYYENKYSTSKGLDMSEFQNELAKWQSQMSAASSNLANIRSLAEQQYEHNTLSADTQASINSSQAQNQAYYDYLYSKIK